MHTCSARGECGHIATRSPGHIWRNEDLLIGWWLTDLWLGPGLLQAPDRWQQWPGNSGPAGQPLHFEHHAAAAVGQRHKVTGDKNASIYGTVLCDVLFQAAAVIAFSYNVFVALCDTQVLLLLHRSVHGQQGLGPGYWSHALPVSLLAVSALSISRGQVSQTAAHPHSYICCSDKGLPLLWWSFLNFDHTKTVVALCSSTTGMCGLWAPTTPSTGCSTSCPSSACTRAGPASWKMESLVGWHAEWISHWNRVSPFRNSCSALSRLHLICSFSFRRISFDHSLLVVTYKNLWR